MSSDGEEWKGKDEEWPNPFMSMFGLKPLTPEEKAEAERRRAERKAQAQIAALTLPSYRPDQACVMCGHAEAKTLYCSGGEAYGTCYTLAGEEEHLHRTCRRCKYVWYERTLRGRGE